MEHILRNVVLALLEQRNANMHDILRVFADKTFRTALTKSLKNPTVKNFFEKEYVDTPSVIARMASHRFKTKLARSWQIRSSIAFLRLRNQKFM